MPAFLKTDHNFMPLFMGIDPGASGGMAIISANGGAVDVVPMRDEADVAKWLEWATYEVPVPTKHVFAALEQVGGWTGGNVKKDGSEAAHGGAPGSAMFKFGQSYGFIRGCLFSTGVAPERMRDVVPRVWQECFSLRRESGEGDTAWKTRIRDCAQKIFPSVKVTKKTADALMIAEWLRQQYMGEKGIELIAPESEVLA